jgi:ketosteroid isomerase-like protein
MSTSTEAVEAAARTLLDATTTADLDTLDRMLAPAFTYTHASSAHVDSREEWLESYRTGGRRYRVYDCFEPAFIDLGDVVVMRGRAHQEMSPRGERIELNTRFTSIWIRLDGAWKCTAWQATRIQE